MLLLLSLLCSAYSDLSIDDSCQQSSALSLLSLFESSLQRLLIMPIYYILYVLMPSSLLYLPSMTSIHCLLNIFQHLLHPLLDFSPSKRQVNLYLYQYRYYCWLFSIFCWFTCIYHNIFSSTLYHTFGTLQVVSEHFPLQKL
jgi:hypothetical protein